MRTFDGVWEFLRGLSGQRLHTLDQHKPFTLQEVGPSSLTVVVEETGFPRTIRRADCEEAWQRLVQLGRLSRSEIHREISKFNPAYVSSLLSQLPEINYSLSPIVLTLNSKQTAPLSSKQISAYKSGITEINSAEDELPETEEAEEHVADRLVAYGHQMGFAVQKEWRTDIGNRIDVVWATPVPQGLPGFSEGDLLPVVGFEVETSWRTRKHIKGDIFNLQDLGPSLGVIVLCKGPNDNPEGIESLRAAAQRYIKKLGLRIQVWSDSDVDN